MSKSKKPVGRSGYFRVTGSGEAGSVELSHAEDKSEIEKAMVEMFIRSHAPNNKPIFSNPRQNSENHFDFTVTSARGDAYLELLEIAPLAQYSGNYEKAPGSHKAGELASAIAKEIFKKSGRYKPKRELFLLLYLTHWAFAPGQATIQLLRHKLKNRRHVFRAVFYLQPLDDTVGAVHWLYPVPPAYLFNFRPEEHEDAFILNLDYQKFQVRRSSSAPPATE